MQEFHPQQQLAGLLEWMHERMDACYGKTAVIGISGGKDSSVVAALAVAAYGREHVYGVLMPNEGGLTRKCSGRPSRRPSWMTSSVVYIPRGEKAPALSPYMVQ